MFWGTATKITHCLSLGLDLNLLGFRDVHWQAYIYNNIKNVTLFVICSNRYIKQGLPIKTVKKPLYFEWFLWTGTLESDIESCADLSAARNGQTSTTQPVRSNFNLYNSTKCCRFISNEWLLSMIET